MWYNPRKTCPTQCPINTEISQDEDYLRELQKRELELKQKEKELLKKDKILQKKISKFNKRNKNKAKTNLKAAAKLRDARKKLLLTLDTKDKVQKCDKHNCKKWIKKHAQNKNNKHTKIRIIEKLKRDPCSCSVNGKKRRPSKEPESYLSKIFRRPCSCKYVNIDRGYSPCRGQPESSNRESYWERAAGDCFLMSMRRPPQLWLYNRWPQFYPQYLGARQQCKNCKHLLLFVAGILFWTPCLLCLELCKCCFCTCCTE